MGRKIIELDRKENKNRLSWESWWTVAEWVEDLWLWSGLKKIIHIWNESCMIAYRNLLFLLFLFNFLFSVIALNNFSFIIICLLSFCLKLLSLLIFLLSNWSCWLLSGSLDNLWCRGSGDWLEVNWLLTLGTDHTVYPDTDSSSEIYSGVSNKVIFSSSLISIKILSSNLSSLIETSSRDNISSNVNLVLGLHGTATEQDALTVWSPSHSGEDIGLGTARSLVLEL
ncbi:hypothetical protein GCK72_006539 [Caenorhabditis remanei]|uniref:Uncharacterized protein n=1 Tax=Caenorhabditis remanei TaxID=31234 RepID=A0A6A5HHL6_CAERE|nr:hypothetical protein GCK72_006539 [Caenorhabditis remanei]KAF1766581.1 hypothetical protein GCK72_006539 [Caenorhabditis remanei]